MRKFSTLILTALISISCSNDSNNESEIKKNNFPKVSDIYLMSSFRLMQETGIELDVSKLNQEPYVQNLISSITQLTDYSFDEVCHLNYDSDGLVNSYKIGINQIVNWRFDYGGTIQRDNSGNVISINNNPVTVGNNKIIFKQSDGWSTSNGYNRQVNFNGNRLTKTYFIKASGEELNSDSYSYEYNNDFIKKHKTGGDFTFYEVSEYYNDDFNLPWIIHRSSLRLSLEIAFGLRLMKKIPKKIINSQHSDQDVDITNVIKDQLNRPILILGRNSEYNIDHIAVYQYAD